MNPSLSSNSLHLGIDLGGSSIKAVAVTTEGDLLEQRSIPFEDRDRQWAHRIRDLVFEFRQTRGWPVSLGLSAPGLASREGRSIAHMPGRLIGLEGLDWARFLESPHPIPVLNDAHAALLGEAWVGAARGLRNVFMLTLGTGVGGAAMVDGHLLCGHLGRAGHLGHITLDQRAPLDDVGTPGSLEMAIGNKTVSARSQGRYTSTEALVRDARGGDRQARELWQASVASLAVGINSLINVLDPEAVILGGGIAKAGPHLWEPLRQALEPLEWRPLGSHVPLIPAALGDLAGAYGAARHAMHP